MYRPNWPGILVYFVNYTFAFGTPLTASACSAAASLKHSSIWRC